MCRISGGELADFSSSKSVKARKGHQCGECRRAIEVGERYQFVFVASDGSCGAYKTCSHCQIAQEWLAKNCGGYVFTEAIEEIWEHAKEYPALALPLYRLCVGAKRKWKRFDGAGLLAIPNLPPNIDVGEA